MVEDDLVTLALDGSVVSGERPPSSERLLHLGVYSARSDAGAIVHSHSVHATAWSFLDEPLALGTEELLSGSEQLVAPAVEALADTPSAALAVAAVVERQAQIAWVLRGAA